MPQSIPELKAAILAILDQRDALEAKATPGPWQSRFIYRSLQSVRKHAAEDRLLLGTPESRDWPDAEITATSRNDGPSLRAFVRAEVERECLRCWDNGLYRVSTLMSQVCNCGRRARLEALLAGLQEVGK